MNCVWIKWPSSVFALVDGQVDDVKVYHLHTPFNPLESGDSQQGKPTHKKTKHTFFGCFFEAFRPPLTFDLYSKSRRERKSRPRAHGWETEVRELRHGAGEGRRHDHMHYLPAAGHDQSHLQSRDVRVAHVLTLHLLRVGARLGPPEAFNGHFHGTCLSRKPTGSGRLVHM